MIGINSAIASETGYNVGYGFAIPIDLARQVMEQLIKNGKVERAALGVLVDEVSPTDAQYLGLHDVSGVRIRSFFPADNSPAKAAGLEQGDVVVAIDGKPVEYVSQLQQIVGFKHPGETVKVEVARKGGERRTYTVRLISAATGQQTVAANTSPDESSGGTTEAEGVKVKPLGLSVVPFTSALAGELGYPATVHGLLVQNVDPEGPSAQDVAGGNNADTPDVILSVEGTPVRSVTELNTALKHPGPGGIVTLRLYNKSGGERVERVQLGN